MIYRKRGAFDSAHSYTLSVHKYTLVELNVCIDYIDLTAHVHVSCNQSASLCVYYLFVFFAVFDEVSSCESYRYEL